MLHLNNDATYNVPEVSRRRRTRTIFTNDSIVLMEKEFDTNRYPDIHKREAMAANIGVSEARVQVWFQNRRARINKRKASTATSYNHTWLPEQPRDDTPESRDYEPPRKLRKVLKQEDTIIRSNQSTPEPDSGYQSSSSSSCGPASSNPFPYAFQPLSSLYNHPYLRFPYLNVPMTYTNIPQQTTEGNERMLSLFPVPSFDALFRYPGLAYPGMNMFDPYSDRTKKQDEEDSNVADDNVVDRLFRFSGRNKSAPNEGSNSPMPYQIRVPRLRASSCNMGGLRSSEERNVESPMFQSPATSEKEERDLSDMGQEAYVHGADDSGFANDSSSDSCSY